MYTGDSRINESYLFLNDQRTNEQDQHPKTKSEQDSLLIKTTQVSLQLSTQQPPGKEDEAYLAYKQKRIAEIEKRLPILQQELAEAKRKLKEHNERHELFQACCPIL